MLYPELLYTFVLGSLLVTVPCGSTGQSKRLKYGNRNPPVATTGGSSLTTRLKDIQWKTLGIARYYNTFLRTQQLPRNLPTAYHPSDLHGLPAHGEQQGNTSYINLGGYVSSIQPPNPPLLASTNLNPPDTSGRNKPVGTNVVQVQEEKITEITRLVYRTMSFPPFISMDKFIQTVNGMDLPGEPLTPSMLLMEPEDYQKLLTRVRKKYAKFSSSARPDKSVMTTELAVRNRLSHAKSDKRLSGQFTLLERNAAKKYQTSIIISVALQSAAAVVVVYCKKSDINTYFEVVWYPNHPEYPVERLLAYTMRRYEGVTRFGIQTDGDYVKFLISLKSIMKSRSADICSELVSDPSTLSGT